MSQYSVGADGSFVTQSSISVSTGAIKIRVHPNGKYVYAVEFNAVDQFRISATGELVSLLPASVSTSTTSSTFSINIHPGGEYAYVINNDAPPTGSSILQFAIGVDGTLSPIGTDVGMAENVYSVAIDPSGRYAYVALISGDILQFGIGTDGLLTPLSPGSVTLSAALFGLNIHPTGRYLYVAIFDSGSTDFRIAQFDISTDGQLTPMVPASVPLSGTFPLSTLSPAAITPAGDFLYFSLNSNGIDQFQINSDGKLSPLTPQNFPTSDSGTGTTLNGISLDASGQYAYIPNSLTDMVDQYQIGANGLFADHTTPAVATGSGPAVIGIQNRYE